MVVGGTGRAKRAVNGWWSSILFREDLLTLFPFIVYLFVRLFLIIKYWVQFYVSFQVQFRLRLFADNQYTATENEFIVNYGIWCILGKQIFLWCDLPWREVVELPKLSLTKFSYFPLIIK